MKHAVLSVSGLCLGLAALGVSWFWRGGTSAADHTECERVASGLSTLERRIESVEARIERAEKDVSRSQSRPAALMAPRRLDPDLDEKASLLDRVTKLEESLALVQAKALAGRPQPPADSARVADPAASKPIAEWTDVARNPSASEKERLEALRNLRGARLPDGKDARLAIVEEMVRLAESSTDAEVRADVWRQLSHVTERSMLSPLLSAVQNDSSPKVREEAAETLADFLPDETVRRALLHAAENDQNAKVRSQARDSLGGRGR